MRRWAGEVAVIRTPSGVRLVGNLADEETLHALLKGLKDLGVHIEIEVASLCG